MFLYEIVTNIMLLFVLASLFFFLHIHFSSCAVRFTSSVSCGCVCFFLIREISWAPSLNFWTQYVQQALKRHRGKMAFRPRKRNLNSLFSSFFFLQPTYPPNSEVLSISVSSVHLSAQNSSTFHSLPYCTEDVKLI